ncbi:hypothetical protein DSUL_50454 [Desulfovibrionales bacterium]
MNKLIFHIAPCLHKICSHCCRVWALYRSGLDILASSGQFYLGRLIYFSSVMCVIMQFETANIFFAAIYKILPVP